MPYLFKDSDLAARRLQVLAQVFEPGSRAFLRDAVDATPGLAIDLGCGPGYTTHLLATMTGCQQVIGLDSSEHFLTLACQNSGERISFKHHDITRVPFPVEPGDLISCRFLLTHLQDPQTVIERWATQLRPHGRLLIEEVEWIHPLRAQFRTYLEIVAAMLAQQANQLYIGPLLDRLPSPDGLQRRLSRVYRLPVTTAQAATMFFMNIQTWKSQPFIQQHYPPETINQLEQDLNELSATSATGEIEWGMRQIMYERI
ncbi:MAG: methyltransferase domain-containing protein [Ktedonobacteraceae bacterium]|nr:methyltransferase domain-containing protein [Ktedonobacteraceae bacterium]